jgi:hypothetical protein
VDEAPSLVYNREERRMGLEIDSILLLFTSRATAQDAYESAAMRVVTDSRLGERGAV